MERYEPEVKRPKRFSHPGWLLVGCVPLGLLLIFSYQPPKSASAVDDDTAACLANLNQLAHAYALYAHDYDGKIPRGVDPEDRYNPGIWRNSEYGSAFYRDATQTPYLHEILRPYVNSNEVFHCPADHGWSVSKLQTTISSQLQSGLKNVTPSSFVKYGTSYYCFTKYGFAQFTASDIDNPSQTLLLFDGDLWHQAAGNDMLNGLFADGHAQNLTAKQFSFYSTG